MRVIIPPRSAIRKIIRDKYTNLYRQYHRKYPLSTSYPRSKLTQNIRNAISVGRTTVSEQQLKKPIITDWILKGWYVIPCYSHWYFAVELKRTKKNIVIAEIQDCRYEGDYHNDVMTTNPYEAVKRQLQVIIENKQYNTMNNTKYTIKLTESQLHNLIKRCVNEAMEFVPTFDDKETQERFKNDTIEMLSKLSNEKFMNSYFHKRLQFDDPDTFDAIWKEYVRRKGMGGIN